MLSELRLRLPRVIAAALFSAACLAALPRGAAAQDAGAFITNLGNQAIQVLGPSVPPAQRIAHFKQLFSADFDRQPYVPGHDRFVVSPENARDVLGRFLAGARKQLLIYDPKVSDDAMLKIITDRIKAGVDVRVIGKVESKWNVKSEKYPGKRLHIRAIIRDGKRAFMGSQSLRRLELEKRREVGVIIADGHVVDQMKEIFEEDWAQTESGRKQLKKEKKAEKKEEKHHLAAAS